jgi:hypothetical protein
MIRKLAITFSAAAAVLAGGAGPVLADGVVQPRHHITCSWWNGPTGISKGTPWSPRKPEVRGYALVRCSDRLDEANTAAQIQILVGADWKNLGSPTVSHSTGTQNSDGTYSIYVLDKATMRTGGHKYRTMMTHFGLHGNISTLPTHYSPTRYLRR